MKKPVKAGASRTGPSQRQLRVAEEIRHVLSGIFGRNEFRDPDLAVARITVTEVRIGPDLKRATAFITRLGRSDVDVLIPALVRATPYLRGQVAKALRLRIAPDLTFTPDMALDYAMKIDELMHRPEIARDLGKDGPVVAGETDDADLPDGNLTGGDPGTLQLEKVDLETVDFDKVDPDTVASQQANSEKH